MIHKNRPAYRVFRLVFNHSYKASGHFSIKTVQSLNNHPNSGPEISYSLLDVIGIIYRWRRYIFLLGGTALIVTTIVALLLPNYYTSTAIFAPANEEKELFTKEGSKNNSLYADEDAVDRMLIFANSSELVGHMIQTFNLSERYGIDGSTDKGQDRLQRRFRKLYDVRKNEYGGIEIAIQDREPQQAADMVREALARIAQLRREATSRNRQLIMETYQAALDDKRAELRAASDSLFHLRSRYNIYDAEKQGQALAELVVNAEADLAENQAKLRSFEAGGRRDSVIVTQAKVRGLMHKLDMLRAKGDTTAFNLENYSLGREAVLYYDNLIESISETIGTIQDEFAQFRAQATTKADALIILEPAEVPKVKSYPFRSLIIAGITLLALLFGCLAAIVLDVYRKVDWKRVLQGEAAPDTAASAQPANGTDAGDQA